MQRIRNRIFEYMEGVIEYEVNPGAWDLNDLVNEWELNVNAPFDPSRFSAPAFTENEIAAMATVHSAWLSFASATPKTIVDENLARSTSEWKSLLIACTSAAKVFGERGRLDEEHEIE